MRAILFASKVRNCTTRHHLTPQNLINIWFNYFNRSFRERSVSSILQLIKTQPYNKVKLVGNPTSSPSIPFAAYTTKGAVYVEITFVDRDRDSKKVRAKVGDTLLDVAKEHDIDVEGACGGTLACSTCHLIFDRVTYKNLPDEPTDEELDMLELAYGLTDTSRLGCQVDVTEDMDGIVLQVPTETRDARDL